MRYTYPNLLRRLAQAGFKKEFVSSVILPDWWEPSYASDSALLPEIEIRVARFLGVGVSALRDPDFDLAPPQYAGAQLRRVRDVDRASLTPAIHAAIQIAAAVVRCLRPEVPPPSVPPRDGLEWRTNILSPQGAIGLSHIVDDLWSRGIPVIPVDVLPSPSFQAICCIIGGRPAILLTHRHDEPGRVAFLIAHEVGHIATGDCQPDRPVIDSQDEVTDDSQMEQHADRFAARLLVGSDAIPMVEANNAQELAKRAFEIERREQVDAGAVIYAWARRTHDYATATIAVKALYRAIGARRLLRHAFDRWVDIEEAAETDRALLRCVYGDPTRDATAV